MLDKLGKADLGEATKAMGLVFAIGLVLAVIGGTLNVMIGNDATDYADSDIITEDDATTVDATRMIGYFHQTGKGIVGLLAFWFPIIGMILIAVGIGTLVIKNSIFHMILIALGVLGLFVLFEGIIPIYGVVSLYLLALYADVQSTVSSKLFPKYERNIVIACLYKKMELTRVWAVYGVIYTMVIVSGYMLLENVYVVLAVMASVHIAASIGNVLCKSEMRPDIVV